MDSEGGSSNPLRCGKHGKIGHQVFEYKDGAQTCFNYGKQGQITKFCKNLKQEPENYQISQEN